MKTGPASLYEPADAANKASLVDVIQHGLRYAKYGLAGAIGALALVQTIEQFGGLRITETVDLLATLCGALVMMAVAKRVHIL